MEAWLVFTLKCLAGMALIGAAVLLLGLLVGDLMDHYAVEGHEDPEHGFVRDDPDDDE
jgi:hypothetical protein